MFVIMEHMIMQAIWYNVFVIMDHMIMQAIWYHIFPRKVVAA